MDAVSDVLLQVTTVEIVHAIENVESTDARVLGIVATYMILVGRMQGMIQHRGIKTIQLKAKT